MNSAFNHLKPNDTSAIEVTFGELAPTPAEADKAFFLQRRLRCLAQGLPATR